ncbi:hypothetical protein CLV82_0757 [Zeaxanthinibacter enoshimensis]|uniref:Uncharacterized protein n=1 Tax=Zeaxanthinibacter enoshimensis TaxID=392009 RepID=A0A4R6TSQ0_9FLAO|nr:hypothetical protein CLV82_0757 [Zeaxanthinibacter enoshimensis]
MVRFGEKDGVDPCPFYLQIVLNILPRQFLQLTLHNILNSYKTFIEMLFAQFTGTFIY